MQKLSEQIHGILAGGCYVLCNYLVANIPCWHIRRVLYRLLGMKVGKGSRIMMKVTVTHPWKIRIGCNTVINEHCYLDGRGSLEIGDNVNVSIFSVLITGSHRTKSPEFEYYTEPIKINDGVWIAARSTVLNGCVLEKNCVISAGAVVMSRTKCEQNGIYVGVPAVYVRKRELEAPLTTDKWHIHFR